LPTLKNVGMVVDLKSLIMKILTPKQPEAYLIIFIVKGHKNV
jgi:hypothetical protein